MLGGCKYYLTCLSIYIILFLPLVQSEVHLYFTYSPNKITIVKQLLLILIFLPIHIYGQDCNCESNFNWTKKTFEENDAGFQYIIDTKGEQAYKLHNQMFIDKIENIKDTSECQQIINEWLWFFRKGHVGLQYIGQSTENKSKNNPKAESEKFKGWETYSTNIIAFKKYLNHKSTHNYEGVWETGSYKIGIKQEGDNFIGFIIDSEVGSWGKEQVKLKISNQDNQVNSVFYMLDHSAVTSENVILYGTNNLQIGDINLTRIYPEIKDYSPYNFHFKALNSELPFIEQLNKTTIYFRIPSFAGTSEKKAIDSILSVNKEKILNTENLIIDIRNGTGGSDSGYSEILPFIYTNPIRTPGAEFLSTSLNNQRMLDFSNNTGLALEYNMEFSEKEKKEFKNNYDTLTNHLGEFVNLDSTLVSIITYDTIHPFPKNVGIIHNHRNASTDEQFLLAAKQSKKVKLFGRTTMGALDVSNLNIAKSPCEDYVLWYALSKSSRIPNMAIDDKGIQPDYYIDEEIPEYEWINFVSKILNE